MKTLEYTTIDRTSTSWPSGPWDGEPDKVQWPDEATGLPCLAVRQLCGGNWCGYVGVAPSHPWHGLDYDAEGPCEVEIHGGLTFANGCVCHLPEPGEEHDAWWFGFDCAHLGDLSPLLAGMGYARPFETYKGLSFVKAECESLAKQIAAAAE